MLVTSSRTGNKSLIILENVLKQNRKLNSIQKTTIADLIGLLASCSSYHRYYGVNEINHWFIPPLLLNQYITIYENNKLVAFITYANLDRISENCWLTQGKSLDLDSWNSGSNIWMIDCLAPFGHGSRICSSLRKRFHAQGLKGKIVRYKRRYPSGQERISKNVI